MRIFCYAVICMLGACTTPASGPVENNRSVLLQWDAVTQRENGEPFSVTDLSRYEVEQRVCETAQTTTIDVVGATRLKVRQDQQRADCYEFRVRAIDKAGASSAWSSPVRARF